MKKINLQGVLDTLSEKEMKNVRGGSGGSNDCSGKISCSCNSVFKGCVSSVQECIELCNKSS
jgi:natural product precursor